MDPNKVRIIAILVVLLTALVLFTVGFSTKNHVKIRNTNKEKGVCDDYRYGLFQVCKKSCKLSDEDCVTIDYKYIFQDSNNNNTGRYAYLIMFVYAVSCLSLLLCLLPFFKIVNKYYVLVLITEYGVAGILGIIFSVLYTNSIIDAWMDNTNPVNLLASTSWSHSIDVAALILMVVSAGISVFILRRYPDTLLSFRRQ